MARIGDAVNRIADSNESQTYYSASNSPYLQGAEIVQLYQLLTYTNVKIRSNTSLALAVSGSIPGYANQGSADAPYDDHLAPENYGTLRLSQKYVYTPGRKSSDGPSGVSQYTTFLSMPQSPTQVATLSPSLQMSVGKSYIPTGSLRSQASLFNPNRLETYVSHIAEKRDLGQSDNYSDGLPFFEPDSIEIDPTIMLQKDPEAIEMPTSLVAASMPANFDGVIEVFSIRSISDRTSTELPYIARSVKGSLGISDEKNRSFLESDQIDTTQFLSEFQTAPFLDSVGAFGLGSALIDQPGAFSDNPEKLSPFVDLTQPDIVYSSDQTDSQIKNLFLTRFASGSVDYNPKMLDYVLENRKPMLAEEKFLPSNIIICRHGFTFSQNDNYGYDSIAFGGLLK